MPRRKTSLSSTGEPSPMAALGLSLIGGLILEVLCDERLHHQLIATLRIIGVSHLQGLDIGSEGLKKDTTKRTDKMLNLEAAERRLEKCASNTKNEYTRDWYNCQTDNTKTIIKTHQEKEHRAETDTGVVQGDKYWTTIIRNNRKNRNREQIQKYIIKKRN